MFLIKLRKVFTGLCISLVFVATSENSAYSAFPCTWAPGEVQVGDDKGVPLCEQHGPSEYNQGGDSTGAEAPRFPGQLRLVDTYIAVAMHKAANDPWAIWGNPTSLQNAEERALEACNSVMRGECYIAASGANIFVSLGYARLEGALQLIAAGSGATLDQAIEDALRKCESKGFDCISSKEVSFGTAQVRDPGGMDLTTMTYYPTEATVKRRQPIQLSP